MKAYISKNTNKSLRKYLEENDCELTEVFCDKVHPAIASHPDIIMCSLGSEIYYGNKENLGAVYPHDIKYNAASTGKYFIHNLKYTDSHLLQAAKNKGQIMIDIKQGYAKCNITIVDENSIITSDSGIFHSCANHMDVLLIKSGHILLPGFDYGFIGGCSGKLHDTVFFHGDLTSHPDFEAIKQFIEKRNLKCKWFGDHQLTDIGSVIIDTDR